MNQYTVKIKNSAKSDLKKLKRSHLKEQFIEIGETLKNDPYKSSQSFEKLEPKSLKRYSRRINHQHRVVYTVDDQNKEVLILATWSHYE
ncbi:TPA: Txe/YoeB family addiction module toxin [Staphylococcus aureus]|nr:Txe/YoeB family addiction module toxin [Staphylococcus aureus]HDB3143338.1 Txe/YoeB family addiction module toxin [Staphylococcus aureus]HDE8374473.1 Txe/YoeB family addiction module toxin [Staphylococcus aureus]